MNTNFYAIEITSCAYDQRYLNQIHEAQLAESASAGHTTLLAKIMQLFVHAL
jgi:hypothetical protein